MNAEQLKSEFFSLYGDTAREPMLCFAPGRVNLIGEHTDYNGGFVLPCAIQFGTYLLIRPSDDGLVKLASLNKSFRTTIPAEKVSEKIPGEWVNYPLGVMDQFWKQAIRVTGLELLYYGDIPDGAGLSSSASIEMVTAFALNEILRGDPSLIDLIHLSQRAENEFVGVNCGIMDQFASGMGEKSHAIFLNCLTLENKMVPALLDGYNLVIGNTNKKRELADSKYNERVAECQLAVTYLDPMFDISKLGEISFMQFFKIQDKIPDEVVRRRARHVISENLRVLNAVNALWKNELVQFGALMNASHESLRDNYEVTSPELDTMAELAQGFHGCIGSRMTGAGFGGCTVSIVSKDATDRFMNEVGEGYRLRTGLNPEFYIAQISDGVHRIG